MIAFANGFEMNVHGRGNGAEDSEVGDVDAFAGLAMVQEKNLGLDQ